MGETEVLHGIESNLIVITALYGLTFFLIIDLSSCILWIIEFITELHEIPSLVMDFICL